MVIILPLLDKPRHMAVNVKPPAEEMFHKLPNAALVADKEEEEIRIVLAVEEGGLGENVQHGADPLRPLLLERKGQELPGGAGPLVRHDFPPSSRRNRRSGTSNSPSSKAKRARSPFREFLSRGMRYDKYRRSLPARRWWAFTADMSVRASPIPSRSARKEAPSLAAQDSLLNEPPQFIEPPTVERPRLAGLSLFRGEVCTDPACADDTITPCGPRQRCAVVGSPRAQVGDKMRRGEKRVDPAVGGRHLVVPDPGHLPAAVPQRLDPDIRARTPAMWA